jgi:predicted ATPase with chaperone activity
VCDVPLQVTGHERTSTLGKLDECAEIGVSALEALRTPLEDGEIRLARRDGVARYPARFQLVLAADLCPCAPADPRDCICAAMRKSSGTMVQVEQSRVSAGRTNSTVTPEMDL